MALRTPAFNDAKSYGFEWLRAMLEARLQEGVIGAGDLKVTAAAAGGQRVDIAAGTALVKGDSGVPGTGLSQGLFLVVNDAAVANAVTLNASDVTNPRIDQIVLRVRDSSDLGSGADDALFEVVQGVPTAGATLDNRNGAAALPNDRLRLADVLVPAGSSAVSAGNVRDRRPWARGAHRRIVRSTNAGGGSDYSTSSTNYVALDATNLAPRIECSGGIVEVTLAASIFSAVDSFALVDLTIDSLSAGQERVKRTIVAGSDTAAFLWRVAPALGSHIIAPWWKSGSPATTVSLSATAARSLVFQVRELVHQDGDNT